MTILTATLTLGRFVSILVATIPVLAVSASASAGEWNYLNGIHGRGYVICDAVLRRLNSYQWTAESTREMYGAFVGQVVLSYRGWKEPPWQDLNPDQYRNLIRELLRYREFGADVYFGRKAPQHSPAYQPVLDKKIEELTLQVNGLRVWRTHLINWLDEKPAPDGDQTVVNLTYPFDESFLKQLRERTPDIKNPRNPGMTFLVKDDLSGPDPRVREGHQRRIQIALLFDDKPHFLWLLATGRDIAIFRDFGTGPRSFCELEFDVSE
jgi:hypothetical protein